MLAVREPVPRSFEVRASSADPERFTIDATISTETPVRTIDPTDWCEVDEVLLAAGADPLPRQVTMLNAHQRGRCGSCLGSVRSIRRDGLTLAGRLHFDDGDPFAVRIFNKYRRGHITDVSVGYAVLEAVRIEPGRSARVAGRTFTAGPDRPLRIAVRWKLLEVSCVPLGADPEAKVRELLAGPRETWRARLCSTRSEGLFARVPTIALSSARPHLVRDARTNERVWTSHVPEGLVPPRDGIVRLCRDHDVHRKVGTTAGWRVEGGKVYTEMVFDLDKPEAWDALERVHRGELVVSVGTGEPKRSEWLEGGQVADAGLSVIEAPPEGVRIATMWGPIELSLVEAGADPGAIPLLEVNAGRLGRAMQAELAYARSAERRVRVSA